MQSQPPPKGSLEELFRHHLLESEAAAVPPRPLVWEHIDNSLLLAQNEKYRRRLLVHRWGMAASLLLATLAGGGWWHSQQVATATLAANTTAQREAVRQAVAGAVARPTSTTNSDAATLATTGTQARRMPSTVADGTTAAALMADNQATSATTSGSLTAYEGTNQRAKNRPSPTVSLTEQAGYSNRNNSLAYEATTRPMPSARQTTDAARTRTSTFSSPNAYAIAGTSTSPSAGASNASFATSQLGTSTAPGQQELVNADNAMATLSDARGLGEEILLNRLASLALAAPTGLPTDLVAKALPPVPTELRHWRYGAEYAVSAFQPNIDFNRSSSTYNSALGTNTISLTRAAAAEYRANLRPGLGQRLTLRATRWLGGHWSLSTGLEVAQKTAYSATSAAFTGEQLADVSSFSSTAPNTNPSSSLAARELQESSFRYRSAGIPIELQYDNQAKNGISFYGRIGAIVSALLSAHSEVASNPEATRTYTAFSASSPYRRLTALLRGSAGVRYRPAGRNWGLNVGPTAEAGVQSLNAETDRSFLQQQRPYSVGIEAGIEFGGSLKPVPATN